MAIAFDALSQSAEVTAASSVSWSHTTSGSDRAMFIGESNNTGFGTGGGAATYPGATMAEKWDRVDANNITCTGWTGVQPNTSSNTAQMTWEGTADNARAVAVTLTGVDQTTPVGTAASAIGTTATATVNVSSATDELVLDFTAVWADSLSVGASQTQRMNVADWHSGGVIGAGVSTEPGASTVTMSWSLTVQSSWAIGAIPFKPAAGGAVALDAGDWSIIHSPQVNSLIVSVWG